MIKNIKVSILIITYNQKDLLQECIESCLKQTHANIEIVVADDASIDGTQDLLRDYEKKYPSKFILRLSKTNQGITRNSNLALAACTGKYIAIMGGDDLMYPNKIQRQVELMESNPTCDICYHDMEVFESGTNKVLYLYGRKNKSKSGNIKDVIRNGSINCASATMYRSGKIPESGFREELPVASDWMFTIDVLSQGGQILFIDEVLGRYRRHASNVTNSNSSIRLQGEKDMLRACSICMENYCDYSHEAVTRLASILRETRKTHNSRFYKPKMSASLKCGGGVKSLIGLLVYKFSIGKIIL